MQTNLTHKKFYLAVVLGLSVTVLLVISFYTNNIWEDFFITFKYSKNLCLGKGLVYTEGEKIHGFTSPLGVLLPAFCYWLTGCNSYTKALWLFRIAFCIPFFSIGIYLFYKLVVYFASKFPFADGPVISSMRYVFAIYACLFLMFDIKSVLFSINGMETAFMICFLSAAYYLLFRYELSELSPDYRDNSGNSFPLHEKKNLWIFHGIVWAGLMWTRPDSCFYIGLIIFIIFICRLKLGRESDLYDKAEIASYPVNRSGLIGYLSSKWDSSCGMGEKLIRTLTILFRIGRDNLVKAILLTTILYLPWFLWTWYYYGTPVPHTVVAKSALLANRSGVDILINAFGNIFSTASTVFAPPYPDFSLWPPLVKWFCTFIGIWCAIYWLFIRIKDPEGKAASFIFFCMSIYLSAMPFPYPWYFPPLALTGILVIIRSALSLSYILLRKQGKSFLGDSVCFYATIGTSPILFLMIIVFLMTAYQVKVQQQIVEFGTRMKVGRWLKKHVKANERVYVECLGYIGYFSGAKMLDYPGLATRETAELIRTRHLNFISVAEALKPEWMALRYYEVLRMYALSKFIPKNYRIVTQFNSLREFNKYGFIPAEKNLYYDSWFFILKRKKGSIMK